MRVYLDICALQRPLDDQTQLRVRVEADAVLNVLTLCESGALSLVTSGAHTVENAKCPYPDRRAHVSTVLRLSGVYAPLTTDAQQRTERYEREGLQRLDALHLALAVDVEAEFFCTTDDALLKRGRTLNTGRTVVVSPLELVAHLSTT